MVSKEGETGYREGGDKKGREEKRTEGKEGRREGVCIPCWSQMTLFFFSLAASIEPPEPKRFDINLQTSFRPLYSLTVVEPWRHPQA